MARTKGPGRKKSSQGFAGEGAEEEGFGISEEDLASLHLHHAAASRFLDRYDEASMRRLMEEVGLLDKLRRKGHPHVAIAFDLSDEFVQKMTWTSLSHAASRTPSSGSTSSDSAFARDGRSVPASETDSPRPGDNDSCSASEAGLRGGDSEEEASESLLCECVLRRITSVALLQAVRPDPRAGQGAAEGAALVKEWAAAVERAPGVGPLKLCVVEWLLLQDPSAELPPGRLLPAQRRPGLGVQRLLGVLLTRMAHDCGLDALVNRPLYFHNAVMYAAADNTFLNPHMEDAFRGLCRDLSLQMRQSPAAPQAHHQPPGAGHSTGEARPPVDAVQQASGAPAGITSSCTTGGAAEGAGSVVAAASLAAVSHAINCGALRWGRAPEGEAVRWTAQEQMAPISQRAKHFLQSRAYQEACVRASRVQMPQHLATVHALMHPPTLPQAQAESSPLLPGAAMPDRNNGEGGEVPTSTCRPSMGSEEGGEDSSLCQEVSGDSGSKPTYYLDWEVEVEDVTAIKGRLQDARPWYSFM